MKALVAYATKYGSTGEISEAIGEVLRAAGIDVDVTPVDDLRDLSPYQAVIMGSAMYVGKWRKEAVEFINENERTLADKEVWLFTSGPTGEGDPVQHMDGWVYSPNLKPVIERIRPHEVAVFHGKLDVDRLNFIERKMIEMVDSPVGDFRDWDSIRTWAGGISDDLKSL
jgi:menaquinone-dependent protoporphyrinogen oxidase